MAERGAGGFNLFGAEDRALAEGRALAERLADTSPQVRDGVAALVEALGKSVREQRRLVRLSDRQQEELARRTAEAEEALARLQEAQETLVQAEKLASLGALVGGVAHEINTPVGIALSCASHLADATQRITGLYRSDDVAVDDFETYLATAADTARLILANCERAAELIRSFKQVAVDRTSSERRRFDLAATIAETVASLGPRLRQAGHRVVVDCPAGIEVESYPGALSQVLTNLVMNSVIHGYDDGRAGTLAIAVDRPQPGTVRLVYRDDGKGIPDEHKGHIFDPFFTTRRGSGGSGLGLHIVYNLVTGPLQGTVGVAGDPAGGAVFTLTFAQTVAGEA
jgi:signal transduction histidine kinase